MIRTSSGRLKMMASALVASLMAALVIIGGATPASAITETPVYNSSTKYSVTIIGKTPTGADVKKTVLPGRTASVPKLQVIQVVRQSPYWFLEQYEMRIVVGNCLYYPGCRTYREGDGLFSALYKIYDGERVTVRAWQG